MEENKSIFEQLMQLNWLLHRYHQQNQRDFGPMGNPHRGQGRILALLKLKPDISQKELSHILDISSQSLGELLGKLEKNGYITRTPLESDRRIMMVHLTEAGKEASSKKESSFDSGELFESLNQEEQAALSGYLDRIIAALKDKLGTADSEEESDMRPPFGRRGFQNHERFHGEAFHFMGHGHHPGGHHGFPGRPFEDSEEE